MVPFSFKEQSHSVCNYHWYSGKNYLGPAVFTHLQFHTVATVQSALFVILREVDIRCLVKCIKCTGTDIFPDMKIQHFKNAFKVFQDTN